jgi:hypothetical protein
MDIEHDLQRALRRTPAPPDFADRVLSRIAADEDQGQRGTGGESDSGNRRGLDGGNYRRLHSPARWLAAAAAVVMVATGSFRYYEHQRTISEAERVKQEIRLALQITGEKLALAQQRIERSAQDASR